MTAAVLLPLLPAVGFAVGGVHAYGRQPMSQFGEAYSHVTMHLVDAAVCVLLAAGVLSLAGRASTARGRRAARRCAVAWLLVAVAFSLEAAGATIGNGYGANSLHERAVQVFAVTGVLLLLSMLLLAGTRGAGAPVALRVLLLVSVPAVPSVVQAQTPIALALCLTAAAVWALVAATAARPLRVTAAAPAPARV